MSRRRLMTLLFLCLAGMVIGTLGTWSVPLGHGYSAFWPALVIQVAGSVWFGGWGVIAGTIFPVVSNTLAQVGPLGILGYIPANIAQCVIPAWSFRRFRMDPSIPGARGLGFYAIWGAFIPSLAGAVLGSAAVVLFGQTGWSDYPQLVVKWALPHTFVSMIVGIPALRVFTPLWRDLGLLVERWWDSTADSLGVPSRFVFRDMPIKLKLVIAMFSLGLLPLLVLSGIEFARNSGQHDGPQILTPMLLTIAIVATTLAVGWLSQEVIRPLSELRQRVEGMMHGREESLTNSRRDEIGEVGHAFELLLEERRRAEAAALRDQKLQHLGMLAGGIAHDFNNLLQSIILNASMAQVELPTDHPSRVYLINIENIASKASEVTAELLRFSREQADEPRVVDLNTLAQETSDMSGPLLNGRIKYELALASRSLLICVNPGHIEQVILNLILNARDAMPDGGRLCVQTGLDPNGQRVFLKVSDTGKGIPEHVKAQMFEPFFTTKSPGEGTGLGLSIVSDIVRRNRGEIHVSSEVGRGTIFTIYLPRHQEQVGPRLVV